MGRKRKRCAPQWTDENLADVLAHLDNVLDSVPKVSIGGMTEKEAEARIDFILSNLEKRLEGKYGAQQIKHMLFETYRMGDPGNAEWNWRSVFSLGSSQMHSLDQELKDLVRTKLLIIECTTEGRQRIASHHVKTPKRVHQGVPIDRKPFHNYKGNMRSMTSATPAQITRPRTNTPRQRSRKRIATAVHPPLVESPVPYYMRFTGSAIPETPQPQSPSLSESIDPVRHDSRNQRVEVRIPSRTSRPIDAPRADSISHERSTQVKVWSDTEYQDRQELLAEIFALRNELDLSRDANRTLERERAASHAFMLRTNGDADEYMKELKRKQRRIDDLKAQQDEFAFLKPIFSLDTGRLKDLDLNLLQRKYASLRSQLVDFGMMNDFKGFPRGKQRVELLASSEELQALQCKLSSPFGADVKSCSTASVSAQHLVQSLVAVAVRDWVFYEKFTSTATMEVPLLGAYRQHLSTLCDPEFLRSLDFAAHRRVFDQDFFKEIMIPRLASKLGRRLRVTLGPILQSRPERNEEDGKADEALLRERLVGIFSDALELKLLTMVSKDMFECIWPSLETPFDLDIMETERTRFSIDDVESYDLKRVTLVLVPGLRLYEYDRQMVDYFGFRREHEQCTGSYRTLQKAIVLV